ncbi:hypothetical protein ADU90_06060 (plasmid) [Clostridium botulinum]|nr:hypothetical protein ADU89_01520 [Clostridium botulinum]KOC57458.1 hypothetical protein ADU90_06060 [Clostridium botulinum]
MDKGIYIIQIQDRFIGFLNLDFAKKLQLNPSEMNFIKKIIPLQMVKGLDEWIIIKLDNIAEEFDIPKTTVSRLLQSLKNKNVLVQEDFRSVLWKMNAKMIFSEKMV